MFKSIYILFVAILAQILLFSSCAETVPGCTDPSSPNYDPMANRDDGSCTYNIPDTYFFERAGENTVGYDLSLSRQLRIARFQQMLLQLGSDPSNYIATAPLVFSYPDTLSFLSLAAGVDTVVPSTLGTLASGDSLSLLFYANPPLADLTPLFQDAFSHIEAQQARALLGTPAIYTTAEGVDYAHLLPPLLAGVSLFEPTIDSFLLAIDTLDNIRLSSNTTEAERTWDLAFGSFGMPISGASWYDGNTPYQDVNFNDTLDFTDEYLFSYAAMALDRDRAVSGPQFADRIFRAFREGRAALAFGPERLGETQMAAMQIRDLWEQLIAATAIHHMNKAALTLESTPLDTTAYRANWSAAYGQLYSLGLKADGRLGANGSAGVLSDMGAFPSTATTYSDSLKSVRTTIGSTFGFSARTPEIADAWHAAGVANGGTACEDAPGIREGAGGKLYLAYLRDPSGNKLCALHRVA